MTKDPNQMAITDRLATGPVSPDQASSELDLRRVTRILRRWVLLILIIALDLGALMFWWESSKDPYFQSETTIQLTDQAQARLGGTTEEVLAVDREIASQALVIGSREFTSRVETRLISEGAMTASDRIKLIAEPRDGTAAIRLRVEAGSSEVASSGASASLVEYRALRITDVTSAVTATLEVLQQQLSAQEATLDDIEQELDTLRDDDASQSEIDSIDESRRDQAERVNVTRAEIEAAERQISSADGEMGVLSAPTLDPTELGKRPIQAAGLGVAAGLLLGAIVVLAVSAIRDRAALVSDVEAIVGRLPILASIPRFDRKAEAAGKPIINAPGAKREAEAFRFLGASLDLLTARSRPVTVAITSSGKSDGKTATSVNLALALARDGHRIALVDGDVYRIGTSRALGVKATVSTIDVLAGAHTPAEAVVGYRSGETVINLMPGRPMGNIGPSPMTADRLRPMLENLRGGHDIVMIDSPPVLAVSDAIVAASVADMTLLIVRIGHTRRRDLRRTLGLLEQAGARVGGIVMTHTRDRADSYYDY
jgi:capsular exopolysaccharide synthesis family protein